MSGPKATVSGTLHQQNRPITTTDAQPSTATPTSNPETESSFQKLKTRLDELAPGNNFTDVDLANCASLSPQLFRLIKLSLERAPVKFSEEEYAAEQKRVHQLTDPQIGVLMRAISRFSVGEKVVEDELQPLMDFYQRDKGDGVAKYRALFITIQQAEEKIHADFFHDYSNKVFDT